MSETILDMERLQRGGFSDEEISEWSLNRWKTLKEAGFNDAEIGVELGKPPFDPKPIQKQFAQNLEQATKPDVVDGQPKPVTDILDVLDAGFQGSVGLPWIGGLLGRGKLPDKVLAEDAPRSSRIAYHTASLIGDIPAMFAGAAAGGAGGPVTAMGGMFALPAGMRAILMDKYENGEVTTFSEFWDRLSGATIAAAKQYLVGAATGAIGAVRKRPERGRGGVSDAEACGRASDGDSDDG